MLREQIDYRGWTVEVQRKAFRRSISIVLKPGKPVQVRASKGTTWHTIVQFLESRAAWIEKHLHRFRELEKGQPSRELRIGQPFPFLGKELEFRVSSTPLEKLFFVADEGTLTLYLPQRLRGQMNGDFSFAHEALRGFYQQQAERYLREKLAHWVHITGLAPRALQIKEARAKWGSCHPNGKIILNWRLMVFAPEVIDYVIVHELCHLQEMNHSKFFWTLVKGFYAEAPERMGTLRTQYRLADFLERKKNHSE